MNGEKLYEAIGAIDDKYLARLEAYEKKRRCIFPAYIVTGIAAAACVGIIAAGSLILPALTGVPVTAPVTSASETSVSETTTPYTSPTETSAPDTGTSEITCEPETSVPVIVSDTSETSAVISDTSPTEVSAPDTEPPETVVTPPYDDDDDAIAGGGFSETAYGRPVFPLTLLEKDSDITAKRKTTFDYSEWDVNDAYPNIGVTDEYILTNSSSEDKEVTVVYPFSNNSDVYDLYKATLTVNGESVEPTVRAGSMPEDHLGLDSLGRYHYGLYGWDRYKELLSDGTYMEHALNYTFDYGSRPVTVYRFTDMWTTVEAKPRTGVLMGVSFKYDPEKTKVVTRSGLSKNTYKDPETGEDFRIHGITWDEAVYNEPLYIIVSGEDITDLTYDYYYFTRKSFAGGWDSWEKLPEGSAGAEFVRYETDYDHIMREILKEMYDTYYREDSTGKFFTLDFECFYLAYCEYLENRGAFSGGSEYCDRLYDDYWLSLEFTNHERIFYAMTTVTIPAGGSVNVTADMKNLVNGEFCTLMGGSAHCYFIATGLCSDLDFTDISAEIKNYGSLDVTDENFGFDLENGVTKVSLDPNTERYYIEAKIKYPEQP